jgi:ABC-type Zn2+ transport system substrate-binding protein/surface adhesin
MAASVVTRRRRRREDDEDDDDNDDDNDDDEDDDDDDGGNDGDEEEEEEEKGIIKVIFWLIRLTMYKTTCFRGSRQRLIPKVHEKCNNASEKKDQGNNWLLFVEGSEPWEALEKTGNCESG